MRVDEVTVRNDLLVERLLKRSVLLVDVKFQVEESGEFVGRFPNFSVNKTLINIAFVCS